MYYAENQSTKNEVEKLCGMLYKNQVGMNLVDFNILTSIPEPLVPTGTYLGKVV